MFRIGLLIVALIAGGAAAWVGLSMRGEPAPVAMVQKQEVPVAMQDVLVAASDLGVGQPLTPNNIRWQPWPESAVVSSYIVRSARPDAVEVLANTFVRSRMIAGEPIRDEKLIPTNAGFLSTLLPRGKRAVAVQISADKTAGGFILPNDRVDVLLTIAPSGKGEHSTRTILRNVPVLAIDQIVDDKASDQKTKGSASSIAIAKTATLELDPSQVETLVAGEAKGSISLALRAAADNAETPPTTRMQTKQVIRRFSVGSINVVEIATTKAPIEVAPFAPLGPSWEPGQVAPADQRQVYERPVGSLIQ